MADIQKDLTKKKAKAMKLKSETPIKEKRVKAVEQTIQILIQEKNYAESHILKIKE